MPLRTREILELVAIWNDAETARRRDYHAYLAGKGGREDTFEEHLRKYGALIRTGELATPAEIRGLGDAVGSALPEELAEFYTTLGMLRGGGPAGELSIFSARELLRRMHDPEVPRYEAIVSPGLTRMMSACWGNDRFEFDPASGCISAAELAAIDDAYTCVGWVSSDPGLEGHTYVYFDREGRFGSLFYHQDGFDELHEDALVPMIESSPARRSLSEILLESLRPAGRRSNDDDEGAPGER
ncbi:MAG: hypothetical protein NDJ92_01780 [Thermoanaerobaculia bacterium]|nr:hypothetical protein [Thermoanaerobaculia bacterium]